VRRRVRGGGGGGGVVRSRHARRGAGGPKNPKPSAMARFRAAVGLHEVEGGAVGLQFPSRAKMREGMGG
jgi:hypothetical protein